jgi:hypothetical protein
MSDLIEKPHTIRLIVPIFNFENLNNIQEFAKDIYNRAESLNGSVYYLVMLKHESAYLETTREMATLQALTSSNNLSVEVKIVYEENWFETLQNLLVPQDVIVCQNEYQIYDQKYKTTSLSSSLQESFSNQVQIMNGHFAQKKNQSKTLLTELFALFGFLVIIGLFTWFQISIENQLSEFLSKIIVTISFLIEISAILVWHKVNFK